MTTLTPRFETFSYLPPMTDDEIVAQTASILDGGLIPAIEHATDPGSRTIFWSLWKLPLFDARAPEDVLAEAEVCARANPGAYVRLIGYDARRGARAASFVVRRPSETS